MNKKGIMVKFLVTVVLAIMIFAPTCIFTSKFFRASQQAQDNYVDIIHIMETLAEKDRDDTKSEILIMDAGDSIVTFNTERQHHVEYGGDACRAYGDNICEDNLYWLEKTFEGTLPSPSKFRRASIKKHLDVYRLTRTTYDYPSQCDDQDCICLCAKRKTEDERETKNPSNPRDSTRYNYVHQKATCEKIQCHVLEYPVNKFHYHRGPQDLRRVLIEIEKKDNVITLRKK